MQAHFPGRDTAAVGLTIIGFATHRAGAAVASVASRVAVVVITVPVAVIVVIVVIAVVARNSAVTRAGTATDEAIQAVHRCCAANPIVGVTASVPPTPVAGFA